MQKLWSFASLINREIIRLACMLLFAASTCVAQMYTVTVLGTGSARGINDSGQVVGEYSSTESGYTTHAFRTAPNMPINPATDDFGPNTSATAINSSGQVVGYFYDTVSGHAFRTAPNRRLNPATDDLDTLHLDTGGYDSSDAYGINDSGQAVGESWGMSMVHAFRTSPNRPINPETDDLGRLPGDLQWSEAYGINSSGQVVGEFATDTVSHHAFRTAPNRPIDPATDDLGSLSLTTRDGSTAYAINEFGQVVGVSYDENDPAFLSHAFRTAPNRPINPATDDLGTLPGRVISVAMGIDNFGQVVGFSTFRGYEFYHAFLHSGHVMHDLNDLVGTGWEIGFANGINSKGQIAATGERNGYGGALLLTPIYQAFVQQPIHTDGSSVFSAERGIVPVKFAVTEYGKYASCTLPATIAVTRAARGTLIPVHESTYSKAEDNNSNFRITGCQYHYNLAAGSLGVGTYRVDISINGIMVGHAVFALK